MDKEHESFAMQIVKSIAKKAKIRLWIVIIETLLILAIFCSAVYLIAVGKMCVSL